jgi:hypothetical protein
VDDDTHQRTYRSDTGTDRQEDRHHCRPDDCNHALQCERFAAVCIGQVASESLGDIEATSAGWLRSLCLEDFSLLGQRLLTSNGSITPLAKVCNVVGAHQKQVDQHTEQLQQRSKDPKVLGLGVVYQPCANQSINQSINQPINQSIGASSGWYAHTEIQRQAVASDELERQHKERRREETH